MLLNRENQNKLKCDINIDVTMSSNFTWRQIYFMISLMIDKISLKRNDY